MDMNEAKEKMHDIDYLHSLITQACWMMARVQPVPRTPEEEEYFNRRYDEIHDDLTKIHYAWSYRLRDQEWER